MCTTGLLDGRFLFKNYDWEEHSNIEIREKSNRVEVFCPVINRPVAMYTKTGVGFVTTLLLGHKGEAPLEWISDKLSDVKSVEDAVSLLKQGPDFTGFNMIIADKNKAFVVEIWGNEVKETEIKTAIRTNHFFKVKQGPQKYEDYPSSFMRYKRAEELIKDAPLNIETVKKVLSDHENGPSEDSICRHGEVSTQSAIIIDLESNKLYYSNGSLCKNELKELKLGGN